MCFKVLEGSPGLHMDDPLVTKATHHMENHLPGASSTTDAYGRFYHM